MHPTLFLKAPVLYHGGSHPKHDRGAVHPDKLREVCRAGDVAGPDVVGGDRACVVADEVLVPDAVGARRVERVCATPAANASDARTRENSNAGDYR